METTFTNWYLVDHEEEVEGEDVDKDGGGAAQVLHQAPQPPEHCRHRHSN